MIYKFGNHYQISKYYKKSLIVANSNEYEKISALEMLSLIFIRVRVQREARARELQFK